MKTAHEALRQCVEVLKLVDFADCAEKEELWHKLNAAQQVAEEVLKRPRQEPVAYLRFRAAQQWSGSGNSDIEYNEWLETCHAHEIGDDKLPAFPVYADPVAAQQAEPAPTGDAEQDKLLSGQVVKWRKEVARLNDLIATATGQQAAAAVPEGWTFDMTTSGHMTVQKKGLGGYLASPGSSNIASSILFELASNLLAAAPQPAAAPFGDVERYASVKWALRELLGTLPDRRDWLNPDAEKVLRAAITATKE